MGERGGLGDDVSSIRSAVALKFIPIVIISRSMTIIGSPIEDLVVAGAADVPG